MSVFVKMNKPLRVTYDSLHGNSSASCSAKIRIDVTVNVNVNINNGIKFNVTRTTTHRVCDVHM